VDVKFEYLGEDRDVPNSKTWKVEAIHVTTTRNKRKFTQKELEMAGRSLSFRSLNINHDPDRQLPFPDNATLVMNFNPNTMAVEGTFRVLDPAINAMIETGRITTVSIEQIPTAGETCNDILCEQHGVAFIGMALLESDIVPGDSLDVNIKKESSFLSESISNLLISNGQRTCEDCTDFEACHACKHKTEQGDDCISKCLSAKGGTPTDQDIAICISECSESKSVAESWFWYNRIKNKNKN